MSYNPGGGSGSIASSSDVALNNPSDGQNLVYVSAAGKWENKPASTVIKATSQTSSYTLALSDAGTVVEINSSNALSVTVPASANVAFPVGSVIEIMQAGSGQVTIVAASGVTIETPASLKTRVQWSSLGLRNRSTDNWVLTGDLA